ncbi:MAG: ASCH domain-containing protein [Chloroflexi bacterium]|nr:ASCH domain-containing protein [Chloroflexota bacterium]
MESKIDLYWKQFIDALPAQSGPPPTYADSFYFGTRPEHAGPISQLVLDGIKTATGSLKWTYEAEGKPLPKRGDLSVVTDGYDHPVCIIETTDVRVIPFDEVGDEYAREGGEGDRSLAGWRQMYWDYIVSECGRIGREPTENPPLVMERFQVVYSQRLRPDTGGDEA